LAVSIEEATPIGGMGCAWHTPLTAWGCPFLWMCHYPFLYIFHRNIPTKLHMQMCKCSHKECNETAVRIHNMQDAYKAARPEYKAPHKETKAPSLPWCDKHAEEFRLFYFAKKDAFDRTCPCKVFQPNVFDAYITDMRATIAWATRMQNTLRCSKEEREGHDTDVSNHVRFVEKRVTYDCKCKPCKAEKTRKQAIFTAEKARKRDGVPTAARVIAPTCGVVATTSAPPEAIKLPWLPPVPPDAGTPMPTFYLKDAEGRYVAVEWSEGIETNDTAAWEKMEPAFQRLGIRIVPTPPYHVDAPYSLAEYHRP
jgi:hypothetical protein